MRAYATTMLADWFGSHLVMFGPVKGLALSRDLVLMKFHQVK